MSYSAAGNFTVTATATSACGPTSASRPVVVTTVPPAPTVNGPITLCAGQTLNLTAADIPGATFHWAGPNGFTSTQREPSITSVTAAAQGTYTVTASGGGCDGPASTVNVTVTAAPVVTISPTAPGVCAGEPVTLNASGAGNYQWTIGGTPGGSGPSLTFSPGGTTSVGLTGDQSGCPGSTSTLVTVYPLPTVDAGSDPTFCAGSTPVTLSPNTPGGVWSGSPNVTAGGQFTPTPQGTYTLTYTVTSAQHCVNTDQITVTVGPPPTPANAGNDTLVCRNSGPLQLTGAPAGGSWSGNISGSGLFMPSTTGAFTLTYNRGSGSCASSDDVVVTVVNAATVDAGADISTCVDGAAVPLTGSPATGTWSGPGVSGALFTPATASAGTHTLTYTYIDPNGCTIADDRAAVVEALPVVDAGSNVTFCDQPFQQQLTGFSPAGGTWSGDPNVTADGRFTPNGVGTFNLTYTYTNASNCTASAGIVVTVVAITNPANAGNDRAVCINSGALQLSGSPAGGTWSGPHVDAAGSFDPAVAGTFTLTYSVGTASCVTQDQVDITVHPLPAVAITSSPSICLDGGPQPVTATPAGGSWSGTGITDPAGTFDPGVSGAGSFPLTYTYTDANTCTNSTTANATVNPLPVAGFTHAPIACVGAPFTFTDASTGATAWTWTFGDNTSGTGASPSHTYAGTGTFTVVQTASTGAGCVTSSSSTVTVWEGPTVGFTAMPVEGCAPLAVALRNTSSGEDVSYAWDLGNGASSTLEQPGATTYPGSIRTDTTYTVRLTATNLCGSVEASEIVLVHPKPTARFGPDFDSGCSPWPVTFSNVTLGRADSYRWDFGDGYTSTTLDSLVHHTYRTGTNDTTFTATLIATNACGIDTARYTVRVRPNTITAFFNTDTTQGCAPLTVNFTQYSIGVTHWHWEFGDGNVSTAHDASNTYAAPGTYAALLIGDNGCSHDTMQVAIDVLPSPNVDFTATPQPVCSGSPIHFSTSATGIAGLQWTFGDGDGSALTAPDHVYAGAGTWPVTLSATAIANGCRASATRNIIVARTPEALFTGPDPVFCAPATLVFTNTSTGSNLASTWYLDETMFSFQAQPLPLSIAEAGLHTIALVVVDQLTGCRDSTTMDIAGARTPEASFILQPVDPCGDPAAVVATNTSTPDAEISWWMDDAPVGNAGQLQTTATGSGAHELRLVSTLPGPCSDTSRTTFELYQPPVAAFTTDTACIGQAIHIRDSTRYFTQEWWYFNGSLMSTDPNTAAMVPTMIGPDTIALRVVGEGGCWDSLTHVVNSHPAPRAFFTASPMGDCRTIQLEAAEQELSDYAWAVDGWPHSRDRITTYAYGIANTGSFGILLRVTNIHGCRDSLELPVQVPSCVFVPNTFTPNGDGINDLFTPSILPAMREWELIVFDRWGHEVVALTPSAPHWDGSGLPIGVFNWRLRYLDTGDTRTEVYGHVSLVR
ncbi:MAG: PKD domain-containing protein [Flavobacteriales bacterium]